MACCALTAGVIAALLALMRLASGSETASAADPRAWRLRPERSDD